MNIYSEQCNYDQNSIRLLFRIWQADSKFIWQFKGSVIIRINLWGKVLCWVLILFGFKTDYKTIIIKIALKVEIRKMGHNKESTNRPMHIWWIDIQQICPDNPMEERWFC